MINEINEYAGTVADLDKRYGALSDDELLQLSMEGGLTPDAEMALQVEMRRRSLGSRDVEDQKDWEQKQIPRPEPEQRRTFMGYGVSFVGHKYLSSEDERKKIFVASKFIVVRGVSLVPIGSYRVEETDSGVPKVISRVALQGDQVWHALKWTAILACIGLVILTISILRSKYGW